MPAVATGKIAPLFELKSTEGKHYSLREGLSHGPVLAVFFKVECPTCQYTFPFIERLYQQLRANRVQVWGVAQDSVHDSQQFAKEYGLTFPLLIDDHPYKISRAYGLEYVPTIFLIAPDGRVELSSDGFCKADLLKVQASLARHFSVTPLPLFQPRDKVPEFKPG